VLAAGLIRANLQAHLALARVDEQPPSSTPTSLPVRTKGSSLGAGLPWPARDTSFSSVPIASALTSLASAQPGEAVVTFLPVTTKFVPGCRRRYCRRSPGPRIAVAMTLAMQAESGATGAR
jgi:hypothetical protein